MTRETIAHYRLGAKLGAGGMGEVYRATDTKLGREVAVKMIAATVAQDATRLDRFTREAHVLASLNHPNIAAIYGVEDDALIMELVEGETLADRIKRGPIPLDEALDIARQIASGLEAAHDKGIVHRDLKPGNIKITPEGVVKLLDFGLAKAETTAMTSTEMAASMAPTMAVTATEAGMILGTAGYMAPEQARGRIVDKRADVWAFGVILYEMLTGATPFHGETMTDVLASVVRETPDLARVPARVRSVLERCLEKDPRRRLRDVGDAMLLLESPADQSQPVAASAGANRVTLWFAGAFAAALLALAALAAIHFRESAPLLQTLRFQIALPEELAFRDVFFSVSPDGRRVAYAGIGASGSPQLWVQELDTLEPRRLAEVEVRREFGGIIWSPDSRTLMFDADQRLRRVDLTAGTIQSVADLGFSTIGGAWHSNGTVLVGSVRGIMSVPANGGMPTLVTRTDPSRKETGHALPEFLPDGRSFLYSAGEPGARAVFVGSLDSAPDQQSNTPLLNTEYGARFVPASGSSSPDGQLLFLRDGTLLAQRFNIESRVLVGDPVPVADQVLATSGPFAAFGYYSASEEGTLIYRSGTPPGRIRQLTWFNRNGDQLEALSELARYNFLKLSPDATRAVTSRTELKTGNNADLWVTDLSRDTSTRLTFGDGANVQPIWSPDGRSIAWLRSRGDGQSTLMRKAADGSGADEQLYVFDRPPNPNLTDWSSDGRYLVFSLRGDIWALPIGPGTDMNRQPVAVVQGPGNDSGAYISADNRWIAYISNETGRQELYVQPFKPDRAGENGAAPAGGKWMVSRGTRGFARWRADGKELVFIGGDGALMAVDIAATPTTFQASAPRALFQLPQPFLALSVNPGTAGDITTDHEKLLLLLSTDTRQELSVIVNWPSARQ